MDTNEYFESFKSKLDNCIKSLKILKEQRQIFTENLRKIENAQDHCSASEIDKKQSFDGIAEILEANKIVEENRTKIQVENVRLKQKRKKLSKTIAKHEKFGEYLLAKSIKDISERDLELAEKKRLKLYLLKLGTCIQFDKSAPEGTLRGVCGNLLTTQLEPFEFESKNLTKNEISDRLWELVRQQSPLEDEWNVLFQQQ